MTLATNHISTVEARAQGLPGHDTYRFTHLLYINDLNRDFGVRHLCREAMKAFSDTVLIQKRHALAEERKAVGEWIAANGHLSGQQLPEQSATITQGIWANFENLKLAAGFELTLKAILLQANYIVHEIDRNIAAYKILSVKQKTQPIRKSDLFDIDSYRFDGRLNYLPGIQPSSLKFSTLVKRPDYRAVLGLSDSDLDVINEFRALRNQIHFPGDSVDTPKIQAYPVPVPTFLVEFINREIVGRANCLALKYGHAPDLTPLL